MGTDDQLDAGLLSPMFETGRPFLTLGAIGLLFAGGFAIFLASANQFLPHDIQFLGMTAKDLCNRDACRIVHFMIHDRVSFGGVLVAMATLYLWLIHFPLRAGHTWAWWVLLISNLAGFASFLTYLGFGYLDTWHGIATLLLLPCFVLGFAITRRRLREPMRFAMTPWPDTSRQTWIGRRLLLAIGFGLLAAGATITIVGMTTIFVPQDLEYMQTTVTELNSLNPRLLPLIAHDRAGFGAGVFNVGLLIFSVTWFNRQSRHLWQVLTLAGAIGFICAIGVHPIVGYNNPVHLAPAGVGAMVYGIGICLTRPRRLISPASAAIALSTS